MTQRHPLWQCEDWEIKDLLLSVLRFITNEDNAHIPKMVREECQKLLMMCNTQTCVGCGEWRITSCTCDKRGF